MNKNITEKYSQRKLPISFGGKFIFDGAPQLFLLAWVRNAL